jgi:glyoxylase-like metal-dependent hydrolase (beta-lactamase superfamily II)
MMSLPALQRYHSSSGADIFRIPVEAFPGFIAYCYLILDLDVPTLIDTGSGIGSSNEHLLAGLTAVPEQFGVSFSLSDLKRIIITHGHIDHFGGLSFIHQQTGAEVGVHALDRRVLTNYEERVVVATKDLLVYLERAGVSPNRRRELMEMYGFAKKFPSSVPVAFMLEDGGELAGMRFIHTPGHCPGQVCIQIGDILLSADHILSRTSPHQAPESITHYTGLGHYLEALDKVDQLDDVRLTIGGHEDEIVDLHQRVTEIHASHERKLERVRDAIRSAEKPLTISQISKIMYPERHGYDVLLALEEVGAHVEYLYERGQLAVSNLDQVEKEDNPALCYTLA